MEPHKSTGEQADAGAHTSSPRYLISTLKPRSFTNSGVMALADDRPLQERMLSGTAHAANIPQLHITNVC